MGLYDISQGTGNTCSRNSELNVVCNDVILAICDGKLEV